MNITVRKFVVGSVLMLAFWAVSLTASSAVYTKFIDQYVLENVTSGKALSVMDESLEHDSSVGAIATPALDSAAWNLELKGKGYYAIELAATGQSLTIVAVATNAYQVTLQPYTGASSQLFKVSEVSPGTYLVQHVASARLIGVDGNSGSIELSRSSQANAVTNTWKIMPAKGVRNATGKAVLRNLFSQKVLTGASEGQSGMFELVQSEYSTALPEQVWQMEYQNNGYYQIVQSLTRGKLTVGKKLTKDHYQLMSVNDNNEQRQLFAVVQESGGNFRIRDKTNGKIVTVKDWANYDGAPLLLAGDVEGDHQRWSIHRVEVKDTSAPPATGPVAVYSESFEALATGQSWLSMSRAEVEGNCGVGGGNCLRVEHVPSSVGTARIGAMIDLPPANSYTLHYDVFFEPGFEFVKGGKLPGFAPLYQVTGCDTSIDEGWSVRLMWGPNGIVKPYVYHQDSQSRCGEGPVSQDFNFQIGRWHAVSLHVTVNSEYDSHDGLVRLFVDGREIVYYDQLRLRGVIGESSEIKRLFFANFFGGSDSSWSPSKTVYMRFDNFSVDPGLAIRLTPGG